MSKEDNPKTDQVSPPDKMVDVDDTLDSLPEEISLEDPNESENLDSDLLEEDLSDSEPDDEDQAEADDLDQASEIAEMDDTIETEGISENDLEEQLSSEDEEFEKVDIEESINEDDISSQYESELDDVTSGDSLTRNTGITSAKGSGEGEKPEVDNSLSKIAASNTGNIALIVIGAIIIIAIAYNTYKATQKQGLPKDPAGINPNINTMSPSPASASDNIIQPQMPKLPETPQIQVPTIVQNQQSTTGQQGSLALPPVPVIAGLGVPAIPPALNTAGASASKIPAVPGSINNSKQPPALPAGQAPTNAANQSARYKTNMIAFGGGGGKSVSGGSGAAVMQQTSSQVTATYVGDLRKIIAQGKIIDGVLESAISTDLPGMVRAIVSRDTYAEEGKSILIPKGSRLIGTYSANVQNGQARVQITWSRMIRPDGIDIALNSGSVDNVGRTGVVGNYEGRGLEQFTSALMVSALNYGMAALQDKQNQKEGVSNGGSVIVGGQTVPNATVQNPGGSNNNSNTVITTNPTTQKSQALTTASTQISSVAQNLANNYYQVQPRITIDQGAKIKVFVQYDLVFPGKTYNSMNILE